MQELLLLEDVVESLKEKYELIQIQSHPPCYQPPLKTDPLFTYDAGSLTLQYQCGPTLSAREDIKGIHIFLFQRDLPSLSDRSKRFPYLDEAVRQTMRKPCDVLEVNVSASKVYDFFCEFYEHHAASNV